MERLTARSAKNGLAYLVKVKSDEQEIDSKYPNTLRCILEAFNRLAELEDRDEWLRNEHARLTNQSCFDEPETYTTGYRNGHANGRAELIAWLLGITDGVKCETQKGRECDTCKNQKTMGCPNSADCYSISGHPHWVNK